MQRVSKVYVICRVDRPHCYIRVESGRLLDVWGPSVCRMKFSSKDEAEARLVKEFPVNPHLFGKVVEDEK